MKSEYEPDLSSLPGVRRYERNVWRSRMLRLHNTQLSGTALAFAVRYWATERLQPVDDVRVVLTKQIGQVISCSVHKLAFCSGESVMDSPAFEFDAAKGPGSDCRIDVDDGWFEPLLMAALDAVWLLAKRQRTRRSPVAFDLPSLYVDISESSRNAGLDRDVSQWGGMNRLVIATQQIHFEGRRLIPIGLAPTGCQTSGTMYVDLTTTDRVQACPRPRSVRPAVLVEAS